MGELNVGRTVPRVFTAPLPLRSTQQVVEKLPNQITEFGTSSLTVYRTLCLGGGILWMLYLVIQWQLTIQRTDPVWWVVGTHGLFMVLALLTFASRLIDRAKVYRAALAACGWTYTVVLAIHAALLWGTGSSPFAVLGLGDYGGLPCIMLAAVLTRRWSLPLVMTILLVSVLTNYNIVGGTPIQMATGALHSVLLFMPFVVFLFAAVSTTRAADRLASRSFEVFLSGSQQAMLEQFRVNFMGYLHDEVLSRLHAVTQGVRPSVVLAELESARERLVRGEEEIPASVLIEGWVHTLTTVDPGLEVNAPDYVDSGAAVPSSAATVLLEAAMEALSNCMEHAPNARHSLTIRVTDGVELIIADGGPGFSLEDIPHDRAGVRIAIMGRMAALAGGYVDVDSGSRGTTVTLGWSPGPSQQLTAMDVPTAQELTGVSRMLKPWCFIMFMVFVALVSREFWPTMRWVPFAISIAAVCVALGAHFKDSDYRLNDGPAVAATLAIITFMTAASLATTSEVVGWPVLWYPWIFILLCCYLVMRDRARLGWVAWVVGLAINAILVHQGWAQDGLHTIDIVFSSQLLLASWLMPWLVCRAASQMPALWEEFSISHVESVTAQAQRAFAREATGWVGAQIAQANAPGLVAEQVRANTRLLERRLRDCIRCPLFDTPAITEAVWIARARGAHVTLLDDRGTASSDVHARFEAELLAALAQLSPGGELTARLNPPGREVYGSILSVAQPGAEPRKVSVRESD